MKSKGYTMLLGGLMLAAGACSKDSRPPDTAMAEPVTSEGGSATESIAEARCARESRCENIGPDKKYTTMEDCMIRIREEWSGELSERQCPAGIDQRGLQACLDGVRQEECGNPFDTLSRVTACTTGEICAD